jgi:hypothetical protein
MTGARPGHFGMITIALTGELADFTLGVTDRSLTSNSELPFIIMVSGSAFREPFEFLCQFSKKLLTLNRSINQNQHLCRSTMVKIRGVGQSIPNSPILMAASCLIQPR